MQGLQRHDDETSLMQEGPTRKLVAYSFQRRSRSLVFLVLCAASAGAAIVASWPAHAHACQEDPRLLSTPY